MHEIVLRLYRRRGLDHALHLTGVAATALALPVLIVAAVVLVRLAENDHITSTQGLWLMAGLLVTTAVVTIRASQRWSQPMLALEVARLQDALDGQHEANDALRAELERRRRFLTYVHHELRTPVTVVAGSAELLAHPDLDPAHARRLAEASLAQARRLRALVEDLADGASTVIDAGVDDALPGTD